MLFDDAVYFVARDIPRLVEDRLEQVVGFGYLSFFEGYFVELGVRVDPDPAEEKDDGPLEPFRVPQGLRDRFAGFAGPSQEEVVGDVEAGVDRRPVRVQARPAR